jgi:hypothetical protein
VAAIKRESMLTTWLRVLPETQALRFTFTVGSLPVKFYKGDPRPTSNIARARTRSFARPECISGKTQAAFRGSQASQWNDD